MNVAKTKHYENDAFQDATIESVGGKTGRYVIRFTLTRTGHVSYRIDAFGPSRRRVPVKADMVKEAEHIAQWVREGTP